MATPSDPLDEAEPSRDRIPLFPTGKNSDLALPRKIRYDTRPQAVTDCSFKLAFQQCDSRGLSFLLAGTLCSVLNYRACRPTLGESRVL